MLSTDAMPFDVLAERIDDGARWILHVIGMPQARTEVRDLFEGGAAVRATIARALGQSPDEVTVAITLTGHTPN